MRSWYTTEDGLAVWLGVIVVALALPAAAGVDLLGWLAAPQAWLDAGKAALPISPSYARDATRTTPQSLPQRGHHLAGE